MQLSSIAGGTLIVAGVLVLTSSRGKEALKLQQQRLEQLRCEQVAELEGDEAAVVVVLVAEGSCEKLEFIEWHGKVSEALLLARSQQQQQQAARHGLEEPLLQAHLGESSPTWAKDRLNE